MRDRDDERFPEARPVPTTSCRQCNRVLHGEPGAKRVFCYVCRVHTSVKPPKRKVIDGQSR
jgi:LSD1 subclass zinc finger protein